MRMYQDEDRTDMLSLWQVDNDADITGIAPFRFLQSEIYIMYSFNKFVNYFNQAMARGVAPSAKLVPSPA